jgi:hypothetical protein
LWRIEKHIKLKIDADALNRRRRRFYVRPIIYHIYQGQLKQYAGKCACVYSVCNVNNKIENETDLTDCTSNLTYPNLTQTHPILSNSITVCTTENTTESRSSNTNTVETLWRIEKHIKLKIDADALNRRRRRFYIRRIIYHIYAGPRKQYAGKCACVYSVCNAKNKIENETDLTDCISNLT